MHDISRPSLKTVKGYARSAGRLAWTIVREFNHDHGPLMASAMSFHATLSMFPLLLLGMSTLGYVYGSEKAMSDILSLMQQYTPAQVVDTVHAALVTIVDTRAQVLAIGLVALVWTSSALFHNMEAALCITWGVPSRPYWKSRLLSVGMLLVVGMVLAASVGFAALTLRVDGLRWYLFGLDLQEIPRAWHLLGTAFPLTLAVLTFTSFYHILPNIRVHLRAAFLGGLFSGLMWQVALHVFRFFLSGYARYDIVYGSLGSAVVLVLWVYYTMTAILGGAEVAWQADQYLRAREGKSSETPEEKLSSPARLPEGM